MVKEKRTRDLSFRIIVGMIAVVAGWILLTPFVPAVAMSNMKRFHLRSDSFALWSIQQVVPSMYNFGNTVEIRDTPPDMISPILEPERPRYMNHFPMRRLTFADGRYELLRMGQDKWIDLTTTYRGQQLKTRLHAKPLGDGNYEVIRMEIEEPSL